MAFTDLNITSFASDFAGGLLTSLLIFQDQNIMTKATIAAVYAGAHLVYDALGSYIQNLTASISGSGTLATIVAYFTEVLAVGAIFFAFNKWLYSNRLSWKSILLYTLIAVPIGDRLSVAFGGLSSITPTSSSPKL